MSAILLEQQKTLEQPFKRENFPIQLLAPSSIRSALLTLYKFARSADNIADSPNIDDSEALSTLEKWQNNINSRTLDTELWRQMYNIIDKYNLPTGELESLLEAFIRDRSKKVHLQTHLDTLEYCRLSAIPIGRLLVAICPLNDLNLQQIDRLCIGLQLLNFYQDIAQDWEQLERVYIEQEDLTKACIKFKDLFHTPLSWQALKPILLDKLDIYLNKSGFEKYSQWPLFSQTLLTYHFSIQGKNKLLGTHTIFQDNKLKWYDLFKALNFYLYDRTRVLLRHTL